MDPHTRAKHEILGRYLKAWQAILAQGGFPELAYIDGFAGPGRYSAGEDGSPIIALKNALALQRRYEKAPLLLLLFVEKEPERARVLDEIVASFERPDRVRVKVAAEKTFEDAFSEFMAFYETRGRRLPPTFAFIDPFGWTGAPFSIVKKVMSYPSCEVLVNFMYEEINRFVSPPKEEKKTETFFGCGEWRAAMAAGTPRDRNRFLHDLYATQLRAVAGVKYVRSFQMKNDRDVTDYYLFHGTNSLKGLQKMKEAMWAVDDSGEFTFSDATDPDQFVMFEKKPRFDILRKQIINEFGGKRATVAQVHPGVRHHPPRAEHPPYRALAKGRAQVSGRIQYDRPTFVRVSAADYAASGLLVLLAATAMPPSMFLYSGGGGLLLVAAFLLRVARKAQKAA